MKDPYRKFFCWKNDKNEWFDGKDYSTEGPRLDVMLPYWMLEYYKEKRCE